MGLVEWVGQFEAGLEKIDVRFELVTNAKHLAPQMRCSWILNDIPEADWRFWIDPFPFPPAEASHAAVFSI